MTERSTVVALWRIAIGRRKDSMMTDGPALRTRTAGDAVQPSEPLPAPSGLAELGQADRAVYRAVAGFSTPVLDRPLRHDLRRRQPLQAVVRRSLRHSPCSAARGGGWRRSPASASIGITSLVVNQPMKLARRRIRPDRIDWASRSRGGCRCRRRPRSRPGTRPRRRRSPSRWAICCPAIRWPLRAAAATVAFSRVYTGVHYPGDVIVGVTTGAVLGAVTSRLAGRAPAGSRRGVPDDCAETRPAEPEGRGG